MTKLLWFLADGKVLLEVLLKYLSELDPVSRFACFYVFKKQDLENLSDDYKGSLQSVSGSCLLCGRSLQKGD